MSVHHIQSTSIEPRYDVAFNTCTITSPTGAGLIIPVGASAGRVLTSDASGHASWQAAAGGFTARSYLYSCVVPQVLPVAGQELGIVFQNVIFQDPAADVTNDLAGTITINNAGIYLVNQSLRIAGGITGSSLGMRVAVDGFPQSYAEALGGSDASIVGRVSGSQVIQFAAADSMFNLVIASTTSTGQTVGGAAGDQSFLSVTRLS